MDFELSEELKMVQGLARDFVAEKLMPLEREILGRAADLSDARAFLPEEKEIGLVKTAREAGLWGIGVPEELGGAGLSTLGVCLVEEELARTIVPFHFGDVTPILYDCSPAQKEKYLLPALNGEKRAYLALMEPDSSGLSHLKTTAASSSGNYILNGKKVSYSRTGAEFFAIVFAAAPGGPAAFLVEKDTPGLQIRYSDDDRGWKSAVRSPMMLTLKNCRVPNENRLGEEGGAFRLGQDYLPKRRIVRGARCVGAARRLLDEASTRAQATESFGQALGKRADVRGALAEIAVNIHAARLMVYEAAVKADAGQPVKQDSAMVKLYTTRMLNTAADAVSHIFNGPPFSADQPMERLCRRAIAGLAADYTVGRQSSIIAEDILKA